MSSVILIALVLILVASLPSWSYSAQWGYYPSGGLAIVTVILFVLVIMGLV